MERIYSEEQKASAGHVDRADGAGARRMRMRSLLKGARLAVHILYGLMLALIYPGLGQPRQRAILQRWSQGVLAILDVRLHANGIEHMQTQRGALIVANHISWLDVFAVNAVCPTSFVAKSEVAGWPLIGTLCRRARTIFISRASRGDTLRANRLIVGRLAQAECVALFPEGTSTDGTDVAPFHASLLQPALDAHCPVCPVAIHYHDGSGRASRDAAFIGDMTFMQSLAGILSSDALHVTLAFLPPIVAAGMERRRMADAARAGIREAVLVLNSRTADKP